MPLPSLLNAITAAWGCGAGWTRDTAQNPHEAGCLKLDASKARALLGWQPVLRLEDALRWLVEWFVAWKSREDMQAFTLSQIARYQARLLR